MRITREEIERATAEFLAKGGRVQHLSPVDIIPGDGDDLSLFSFEQEPGSELPTSILLSQSKEHS